MDTLLRDPIIAPLFILLALTVAIFILTVARAFAAGTFDATLAPRFLRDYVLGELLPLAVLGGVTWAFGALYPTDNREIVQTLGLGALAAAYGAGVVAVVAKYVAKLLALVAPPADDQLEIDQPVVGAGA